MPAFRFLLKRKSLAAIAVLTLSLALAANTTSLAVLDAFLLSSLGIPDADRVVQVTPQRELSGRGLVQFADAYPNYQLLRTTQHAFAEVTALLQLQASWLDQSDARSLDAARVTASFFNTMRVQPVIGHAFSAADEGPSPAPVVLISSRLWKSSFGGDRGVIGRTMTLNGAPHQIIGVMPDGFVQPLPTDVWLPFDIPANQRTTITGARQLSVYARIKDDVTIDAARADIKRFEAASLAAAPADNKGYTYDIPTLRSILLNGADASACFVQAGAITLLVLATLNLASLLIAWGFERQQEMAVRRALGAASRDVKWLLLQQSIIIVGLAAVIGTALSFAALGVLQQFDFGQTVTPMVRQATVGFRALAATILIAAVAGLAAGVLPAWFAEGADLAPVLRAGARGTTLSRAALRWQQAMVVAQSALSATILVASLLVGISFRRLMEIPDGFAADNRIVAHITLPGDMYALHPDRAAFSRRLSEALVAEPSLALAGFTSTLPVYDVRSGGRFYAETADGSRPDEIPLVHVRRISTTYLQTMGIPLLRGRFLQPDDETGANGVAVVSRALAEKFWRNQDAVGHRVIRSTAGGAPQPFTVVGVVGNTMDGGYSAPPGETIYVPYTQASSSGISIVARGKIASSATIAAITHAVRTADPRIAVSGVASLDALVGQANALPRLRMMVLIMLTAVGVGIVLLGSYGVMSQLVSNRERELAVRLVFGAKPSRLGASVIGQAARLTLGGVAIGLVAVWTGGGLLSSFVFGIQSRSLSVLGMAAGGLLLLACAATLPVALRAMRVDIRRGVVR